MRDIGAITPESSSFTFWQKRGKRFGKKKGSSRITRRLGGSSIQKATTTIERKLKSTIGNDEILSV